MINCVGFVNSRFSSNSYILFHQDYQNVWLIDPGDAQPIVRWMKENQYGPLSGILLTHTHFDHIYGADELLELYPACPVYVATEFGREALFDAKKNASRYTEYGPITLRENANVILLDQEVRLWPKLSMRVLQTPGHSVDSVCFVVDKMMFTGDTLIKDIRTVTKLKGGSEEQLKNSLTLLSQYKNKGYMIYPGHNESFCLDEYELSRSCHLFDSH